MVIPFFILILDIGELLLVYLGSVIGQRYGSFAAANQLVWSQEVDMVD